jgi:energy-coupling factor transporter ATP-binding protein EcfA2
VNDALRFDGVTFIYPDGAHAALHDVDLRIPEGAFALAVGPTGSGKSTLLRATNGLVPQFSGGTFAGRVVVEGRDTLAHPPRRLADVVAFVGQDPAGSFVLDRVEDELAYGMENLGVDPVHMRRRVEETFDLLDLVPLRTRSVRTLSGGERQRVAIGAALAAGPRILVLDEPTSQLDPQGAEDVLAALQRLVHDHGMTVLLAEHRLERVAGWVDLAVGFERGQVRAGTPADVLRDLRTGPPVARVGAVAGWDPVPLTVRDARRFAATTPLPAPPDPARDGRGETVARVRGLRATYGASDAIRDLDLEVGVGEVVAVMGRNGAGKSTLLRALAGVHAPASGEIRVAGHPPRPGTDAALCPQESDDLLFRDTVRDEVRATLVARGEAGDAGHWLDALGIAGLATRHPRDLSAGQRLLVAIASVAATEAPLLLLDEPTRGLDPESKQRLVGFVRGHAGGDGRAVVLATHDVELAAAVATRVVMLAGGEAIADGSPAEVLGDSHVFAPQMTRVFGPGWLTPEQVAEAIA